MRYHDSVEVDLRSIIEGSTVSTQSLLMYHMGWKDIDGADANLGRGKSLRSSLCLFSCESIGCDVRTAAPAAAAIELIHNFSLIHDDIQDGDIERRHRPTLWSIWGRAMGLLAGNSMRLHADSTMLNSLSSNVPPDRLIQALVKLTSLYLEMIEGQYLDMDFETQQYVRSDQYLHMTSKKTGALLEAAMYLGAYLGGGNTSQVNALSQYGRLLGISFQARDDFLGIWGDPKLTGKPAGSDIRRRKKSLPVIFCMETANPSQRAILDDLYKSEEISTPDVELITKIMDSLGAMEYTQSVVVEKGIEALAHAQQADIKPEALRELNDLIEFMINREF